MRADDPVGTAAPLVTSYNRSFFCESENIDVKLYSCSVLNGDFNNVHECLTQGSCGSASCAGTSKLA